MVSAVFCGSNRDADGILFDPELTPGRGNFHGRYLFPKTKESDVRERGPRLLDLLLCVAPGNDPEYMDAPKAGEFAVVDVVTKEKAWFEMPYGCTPEIVKSMVESCFQCSAYRVGNKLWFV
jgi:hypothetical protein